MFELDKVRNGLLTDPLSRTVSRDTLGMLFFERDQLLHQSIVFKIANFRCRFRIVQAVVVANLLSKDRDLSLNIRVHD